MYKVKTYHGFEIEKSMKLLPLTKKALRALRRSKAITFERDDGPEGYESMRQLIEISGAIGVEVFPEYLTRLTKEDHKGYNHYPYCITLMIDPESVSENS